MASEISVASSAPPPVSPVRLEAVPTESAKPAPKQARSYNQSEK